MSTSTDIDREIALAEIADKIITDADAQYFRDKIIKGLQRNTPAKALERVFQQLMLIYHENRLRELF